MTILFAAALLGLSTMPSDAVPPARDGNIAIREELCAARAKGKVEAYDLFIARHAGHPLARQARAERRQLAAGEAVAKPDCRDRR
jgi:hypothetical protein